MYNLYTRDDLTWIPRNRAIRLEQDIGEEKGVNELEEMRKQLEEGMQRVEALNEKVNRLTTLALRKNKT